ncbi:MAG: hypothetical protein K0R02_1047 [Rickettsiaceae bacterium]|jgi:hypothetical protein|nr:hypothetical protein [Rickettsiaceae bacterium]
MSKDKGCYNIKESFFPTSPCQKFLKIIQKDPLKASAILKSDHSLGKCFNDHWEMDEKFRTAIFCKKFPGRIEQLFGQGWNAEENDAFDRFEDAAHYIKYKDNIIANKLLGDYPSSNDDEV